jgi:hypothetical protein
MKRTVEAEEGNCNAGPMAPREFAKQVAAILDTDESAGDWDGRLQKITDTTKRLADAAEENEKLRIALSDCANHAAGFRCTSGMCSTEFLLHVPEEVRLQIGARERERDANKAAMVRVEAERDAAMAEAQAMERSYIAESSRNCEAERALRDALLNVLSSATPHPREHPSMWRTWRQANVLLGRDPDTHVIPTSDKELELRIMSGGRP